ncbi:hypothetical protein V6N11_071513 [Hibiscus sabdariffa]|uniref:Uncharacterized protein n=1 Tax=Hibiscus sabdariffa TaxID=183260 RepID=A0ABR2U0D3_9ROSI
MFLVRNSESDTLLSGPRHVRGQANQDKGRQDDGVKVSSEEGACEDIDALRDVPLDRSTGAELGEVCWRENFLWDGHDGANDALVPVVRDEKQLVDEAVNYVGTVVEGSNSKVLAASEGGHTERGDENGGIRLVTGF